MGQVLSMGRRSPSTMLGASVGESAGPCDGDMGNSNSVSPRAPVETSHWATGNSQRSKSIISFKKTRHGISVERGSTVNTIKSVTTSTPQYLSITVLQYSILERYNTVLYILYSSMQNIGSVWYRIYIIILYNSYSKPVQPPVPRPIHTLQYRTVVQMSVSALALYNTV